MFIDYISEEQRKWFFQKLQKKLQPDVVDLWYFKLWILWTMKKPKFEIMFTPSGFKEIGNRKFEVVAKTKFFSWKIFPPFKIYFFKLSLFAWNIKTIWKVLIGEFLGKQNWKGWKTCLLMSNFSFLFWLAEIFFSQKLCLFYFQVFTFQIFVLKY